jgi:aspartoacylase
VKKFQQLAHVLVSGGTHGNEYTGAFLARHWLQNPELLRRESFKTIPLLANPRAFSMCRRYVERDLNRSFHPSGEIANPEAFELSRALDIELELRKNCAGGLPEVIFDIHSTTAQMGLSLVLTNREPFNILLYAYLRSRFPGVNAYLWQEPKSQPGFLNSLSKFGFAIEIGAVANGVLNAEWVFKTADLVSACLDFVECWNLGELPVLPPSVPLYSFQSHVDYPRGEDGLPAAMIHPLLQGRDFQPLKNGDPVFIDFNGRETLWNAGPAWAVFINEAAYYEKGIAFTVSEKIDVSTAEL